ILLDEPFSALDFQTRILLQSDVSRIIKEQKKSVILITHDIGEAISMADRIVVLSHRPATVKTVYDVDFRDDSTNAVSIRTNPHYQEMFSKIWSELEIFDETAAAV